MTSEEKLIDRLIEDGGVGEQEAVNILDWIKHTRSNYLADIYIGCIAISDDSEVKKLVNKFRTIAPF